MTSERSSFRRWSSLAVALLALGAGTARTQDPADDRRLDACYASFTAPRAVSAPGCRARARRAPGGRASSWSGCVPGRGGAGAPAGGRNRRASPVRAASDLAGEVRRRAGESRGGGVPGAGAGGPGLHGEPGPRRPGRPAGPPGGRARAVEPGDRGPPAVAAWSSWGAAGDLPSPGQGPTSTASAWRRCRVRARSSRSWTPGWTCSTRTSGRPTGRRASGTSWTSPPGDIDGDGARRGRAVRGDALHGSRDRRRPHHPRADEAEGHHGARDARPLGGGGGRRRVPRGGPGGGPHRGEGDAGGWVSRVPVGGHHQRALLHRREGGELGSPTWRTCRWGRCCRRTTGGLWRSRRSTRWSVGASLARRW